jgi:ParB-like chromosome segregation protein Spo0J
VSGQLTLLPSTAPALRRETLPLEVIEGFEDAAPGAKLRELIRDLGLLQPIVVVPARSGRFRVVEGRRRCKAIAQLAEALRLRSLTPALRAAFDEGKITAGAAEATARLPEVHQKALERQLEAAGRLTLADVRQVAREQTTAATTELPDGLFEQQEVAWQVTVRGHLTAAQHAIPPDAAHEQLQRVIGDALAVAEKADASPDA